MTQLTVRGFDSALEQRLQALAKGEGISLSQAALKLMRRGAGLEPPGDEPAVVGSSLDHLSGTWSEEETKAFNEAVKIFEVVDEDLWK